MPLVSEIIFEEGSNCTIIGSNAFTGTCIKSIVFPSKLKVIQSTPFYYTKLTSLYLPASLEEVSSDIFVGQPLENLTIENGIKAFIVDPSGAIYSKNGETLLFVQPGYDFVNIKLTIQDIPAGLLQGIRTLTSIIVEQNHIKYFETNDILYEIETKQLVACPGGIEHVVVDSNCKSIADFAFNGCIIKSIDFNGSKITSLGTASFGECPYLTVFSMPSTVTHVYSYAFTTSNLYNVDIVFGENLETIQPYAFINTNIRSLDFSNVKNSLMIPERFCSNCPHLQHIYLQQTISIGDSSVINCSSLTSINIPESVVAIYGSAFKNCSSLTSVTFQGISSLTEIHASAFEFCNLSHFSLPDLVKTIFTKAFAGNLFLQSFIITENSQLETIYSSAFESCGFIEEIHIGPLVSMIYNGALANMPSLIRIDVSKSNNNYIDLNGVLHSPGGKKLILCPGGKTSLSVDSRVESFERSSFLGCSKLKEIKMDVDQNINSIPEKTFYGSTSLLKIEIPRQVVNISAQAFYGCTLISTIYFAENSELVSLGPSSFSGCISLSHVIFEKGSLLQTIEDGAFEGCSNLTTFTFGSQLTSIGARAFKGCKMSERVSFGNNLKFVGDESFSGVYGMKEVYLPKSIESIGRFCFSGCPNLRKIVSCSENDLSVNDSMNHKEIISGFTLFYVPNTYQHQTAGGFAPIRAVDKHCQIATVAFTGDLSTETNSILSSMILICFPADRSQCEYKRENVE